MLLWLFLVPAISGLQRTVHEGLACTGSSEGKCHLMKVKGSEVLAPHWTIIWAVSWATDPEWTVLTVFNWPGGEPFLHLGPPMCLFVRKKPLPTVKDENAGSLPSLSPCSWDTSTWSWSNKLNVFLPDFESAASNVNDYGWSLSYLSPPHKLHRALVA